MARASRTTPRASAQYWLMKTEPEVFGIAHLRALGVSPWDGVRNYQARNFLRAMAVGDRCLIYHSNAKPSGIAGLGRIVTAAYPDHTAWDPGSPYHDAGDSPTTQRWSMVDVAFVAEAKHFISLDQLRATPGLSTMLLFSRSRLSVQPVELEHFRICCRLAGLQFA